MFDILAAVTREHGGRFTIERAQLDALRDDEVLVRVEAVGICHTDVSVARGLIPVPLPAVLGHEGAGVVVAVGTGVSAHRVGDRVVMSQALCGTCRRCTNSEAAYCENAGRLSLGGRRADGSSTVFIDGDPISGNFVGQSSFATQAIANQQNVFALPDDVPFEIAAPIGCGFMTGAGTVFNDARLQPRDAIAVFGCGAVGLAAIMAARVIGASSIVAVDPLPARRSLAIDLGATRALAPDDDLVERIAAHANGGVDIAIEAAGSPAAARAAVASTHKRGRTIIVGAAPYGTELSLDWWQVAAGRSIQGSVIGSSDPAHDISRIIGLWQQGRFPVERLVRRYPFDRINEAIDDTASGAVVKPVLMMAT